jgi:dCMP deaminase
MEELKKSLLNVNEYYKKIQRPSWDEYFLNLAFHVSLRSEDPDIKHGAIIVNQQNHIIGTGYNGPIKGSDNNLIPFSIRDEKRKWMIHAEENAMLNVTQSSSERGENCRVYVTGRPCNNCLQRMINFGIKKIIMIERLGSITENSETNDMMRKIILMSGVEITSISPSNPWIMRCFPELSN